MRSYGVGNTVDIAYSWDSLIAENMGDERVLLLIRRYLEAGMMDGGLIRSSQEGALKPLSNILLTKLDRELEKRKCPYEPRLSKELFGSVRVADSAGDSSTALVFFTNRRMGCRRCGGEGGRREYPDSTRLPLWIQIKSIGPVSINDARVSEV
jgi:hypothetical protein